MNSGIILNINTVKTGINGKMYWKINRISCILQEIIQDPWNFPSSLLVGKFHSFHKFLKNSKKLMFYPVGRILLCLHCFPATIFDDFLDSWTVRFKNSAFPFTHIVRKWKIKLFFYQTVHLSRKMPQIRGKRFRHSKNRVGKYHCKFVVSIKN